MTEKKPDTPPNADPKEVPPMQAPATMKCVVIPVEQFNDIIDGLKEAPYKTAKPLMNMVNGLQMMDVPIRGAGQ